MTNRNELALDAFLTAGGRLDQLLQRGTPKYFIKSTDEKPAGAVLGSELYYVDTGAYFVYYDDEWHLKVQGSYSDIKFTLTAKKGDLASAVNPATLEVTYDKAYGTLPTTTPTEGYELEGWYFDAQLTNKVSATDIVRIEGNANIYAKHVPIVYSITYNLNDGENDPANPASFTVVTPTITLKPAIKVGYTFGGWYRESAFTNAVTEIVLGSHEAVTLYAKFTAIEYDITYNTDGGTNGANPATYNIETPTIVLADATKEGYTFDGWYEEDTFTTAVTEIALGSTGDMTLYAKFTAIEYDITYELDGGVNDPANPPTYNIEDTPVALADATKVGYDFDGWFSNADKTIPVTNIALGSTGAVTLYAKFTEIAP